MLFLYSVPLISLMGLVLLNMTFKIYFLLQKLLLADKYQTVLVVVSTKISNEIIYAT
jgi:hypothetical protein